MTTEGRVGWKMIPCNFIGAGLGVASASGAFVAPLASTDPLVDEGGVAVVATVPAASAERGETAGNGVFGATGTGATGATTCSGVLAGFAPETLTAGAVDVPDGGDAGLGAGELWVDAGAWVANVCAC